MKNKKTIEISTLEKSFSRHAETKRNKEFLRDIENNLHLIKK